MWNLLLHWNLLFQVSSNCLKHPLRYRLLPLRPFQFLSGILQVFQPLQFILCILKAQMRISVKRNPYITMPHKVLQRLRVHSRFRLRVFHPLWMAFPKPFGYPFKYLMQSVTPWCTHHGLGSFHFARRYFGNRVFFLLLGVLRCFSSPGSLPYVMDWRMDAWSLSMRVSPFGYLRISGCLRLPGAFRSLPRPSSALSAKASTLRS